MFNCDKTADPNFTICKHLNDPFAERTHDNNIKFDPPLYKQRYQRICQLLLDERWRSKIKTIVDFGCAELDLFVYLKNLFSLKQLIFVDIDEDLLTKSVFKTQPLIADHITRSNQLNVKVYVGSVTVPDDCVKDVDAVIAVELIEHLYPDVLEAVPYNIFEYIRPKLAIFTTPNVEFNELFPNKKKFRHADHKFEWTREQFQSWCLNIVERFPDYIVTFDGAGLGPCGTESLGTCTQIGVFVRKDIICDTISNENRITLASRSCIPKNSFGICSYYSYTKQIPNYKLIVDLIYPYLVDSRSEEEKILDEIKYRINLFNQRNSMYFNNSTNRIEIPIEKLIYGNYGQFITVSELGGLLSKFNYTVEECSIQETDRKETCLIINIEMENDDTTTNSETDASGYESDNNKHNVDDQNNSDWEDNDIPNSIENNDKNNKQQYSLYDSGYQKSPLNDESPNLLNGTIPDQIKHNSIDNINELDKFFTHREAMKQICEETAGPSNIQKKLSNESSSIDSDDNSSLSDVKILSNCIIENSLNKIEQLDDDQHNELIVQPIERQLDIIEPIMIVENGDLANNNRDLEGNNYPAVNIIVDDDHHDDDNNNQQHNHINIDNNNEVIINNLNEDNIVANDHIDDEQEQLIDEDVEIAWPSREALYDPDSHIDLFEDFEMDAVQHDGPMIDPNNFLLIGSNINPNENDNVFPRWLIVILNDSEDSFQIDDSEDEPHFYCQGDGLDINDDDDDNDADDVDANETTSTSATTATSSSACGSVDITHEVEEASGNPANPVPQSPPSSEDEFFEADTDKTA